MLSLPYSKNKRYLSGMDWMVNTIDYMSRRVTGVGNHSQIVLELEGRLDESVFRYYISKFVRKFPLLNGWPSRDYNLAPYWKIDKKKEMLPTRIEVMDAGKGISETELTEILAGKVNTPFKNNREHIAFHLIYSGRRSYAVLTFDHRLLDARGAESFLEQLHREYENGGEGPSEVTLTESANLNKWMSKFNSGKNVNRRLIGLSKSRLAALPFDRSSAANGFKFRTVFLDEDMSKKVVEKAHEKAGYMLLMPYMLALILRAVKNIFDKRGVGEGDYVIPVTMDARKPDNAGANMFFNHLSFFLFSAAPEELNDEKGLIGTIKKQMYEQVKSGLPGDLSEASYLMRIVPLPVMDRVLRFWMKGGVASLFFTYTGDSAYKQKDFLGRRVMNLFHMPRLPVPPGLGVVFNSFRGRLNMVLSWVDGLLSESEVDKVVNDLRSSLGK